MDIATATTLTAIAQLRISWDVSNMETVYRKQETEYR